MATVDGYIDSARNFADGAYQGAKEALDRATRLVSSIGYLQPDVTLEPIDLQLAPPEAFTLPGLGGAEFTPPPAPGAAPSYQDVGGIDTSGAPTLSAAPPTLTLPSAPAAIGAFTDTAPLINTSIEFPEPPDQLINPLVADPVLGDHVLPVKPDVVLPVFDASRPVLDADAPDDLPGQMQRAYRDVNPAMVSAMEGQVDAMIAKFSPRFHTAMESVEQQLARYLQGGTGFNPAVENAIYERNRDKVGAEYRRVRDTAWGEAADRGFTLPGGALMSAVLQARQGAADNLARASTEIAIKQAELEQANLQFAVTTSANLRTTMLNAALSYHSNLIQINGQALEFSKTAVGLVVETYNTAIKAYAAALDGYRADAAVYETRLKAAMAGIELYKAEIDALQAMVEVDTARVNVYRARLDALNSLASVYRSRIDAVAAKANMQKLKLELFQSQVQAYGAQVQAKNSEWQGYSAALSGEEAKARIFGTQVQAYTAEVGGWQAKIQAQAEAARASALTNQARAQQYEADVRAYSAVVGARGELARTQLENERQRVLAFQASTQAAVSYATMAQTYYKTRADVQISYADVKLRAQLGQLSSMNNFQGVVANLANQSAGVYAQLAGTAMSGMNALVVKESD